MTISVADFFGGKKGNALSCSVRCILNEWAVGEYGLGKKCFKPVLHCAGVRLP